VLFVSPFVLTQQGSKKAATPATSDWPWSVITIVIIPHLQITNNAKDAVKYLERKEERRKHKKDRRHFATLALLPALITCSDVNNRQPT
jgi:hypothetical protein